MNEEAELREELNNLRDEVRDTEQGIRVSVIFIINFLCLFFVL